LEEEEEDQVPLLEMEFQVILQLLMPQPRRVEEVVVVLMDQVQEQDFLAVLEVVVTTIEVQDQAYLDKVILVEQQ
jgi:hypothetical protein